MSALPIFQGASTILLVAIIAVLGTPHPRDSDIPDDTNDENGPTEAGVNQAAAAVSRVFTTTTTISPPVILSWSTISIAIIVAGIALFSSALLYCFFYCRGNGQLSNSRLAGQTDSSVGGLLMKTVSLSGGSASRPKSSPLKSNSSSSSGSNSSPLSSSPFSQNRPSTISGVYFSSADRSPVRINPPPSTIGSSWSTTGLLAQGSAVTSMPSTVNSTITATKSTVSGIGGTGGRLPPTTTSTASPPTSGLKVARSNPASVISGGSSSNSSSADSASGLKTIQKGKMKKT